MNEPIEQPVQLTKAGIMNVRITSSCNDQVIQYDASLQAQSLNTFIVLDTLDGFRTKITYVNDIFSIIDFNTNQVFTKMRYNELVTSGLYQAPCEALKYTMTLSTPWEYNTQVFDCVGYPKKDDFMNEGFYVKFGNMISLTELEVVELLISGKISVDGIDYSINQY